MSAAAASGEAYAAWPSRYERSDRAASDAIAGAPLIYGNELESSFQSGQLAFIDLMASKASSGVLMGNHLTSCGRSSWSTISTPPSWSRRIEVIISGRGFFSDGAAVTMLSDFGQVDQHGSVRQDTSPARSTDFNI